MNIYDISKKAGVSIATVSRVLNDSDKVSDRTRRRVQAVMEEANYTPNLFARGLTAQSMKIIGILCPDSSDVYLAKAIYFLEKKLRSCGYDCILCCTGYLQSDREKYMNLLLSKKVDAVVLVGSTYVKTEKEHQKYIYQAAQVIPIVLINAHLSGENIFSYYSDDERIVEEVTTQMFARKHKNILFLYNAISYSARKKQSGYLHAIEKAGRNVDERLLLYTTEEQDGVIRELRCLEEQGVKFDAVIATEDYLAIAAMKYIQSSGRLIPDDVEVVGYNDSIIATACTPELSSVDSRVKDICEEAATNLVAFMNQCPYEKKKCIECLMVERGTTR